LLSAVHYAAAMQRNFAAKVVAPLAVGTFVLAYHASPIKTAITDNHGESTQLSAAVPLPVYYPGCNAVRALGKAPLYAGDPGYREAMDGDGDGIACEPFHQ
jgi:Excalibur calcium-binding domain